MQKGAGRHEEKTEGEALLVCICDCKLTQPLVHCPGVRHYPARCSLLYPSTSLAIWKQFNTIFSVYTPLLRV